MIRAFGVADEENGTSWAAIYVIDRDRRVAWRSLSETYKVRATSDAILAVLDRLSAQRN